MVGSAATVADHNVPVAHPLTLIEMRPKSELPFAKEALDHVPVLRHVLTLLAKNRAVTVDKVRGRLAADIVSSRRKTKSDVSPS
jgi:hypothetical protein